MKLALVTISSFRESAEQFDSVIQQGYGFDVRAAPDRVFAGLREVADRTPRIAPALKVQCELSGNFSDPEAIGSFETFTHQAMHSGPARSANPLV